MQQIKLGNDATENTVMKYMYVCFRKLHPHIFCARLEWSG